MPDEPKPNPQEFSEDALRLLFNQAAQQLWLALVQFEVASRIVKRLNSLSTSPTEDAIRDIMERTAEARNDLRRVMRKHIRVLKNAPFDPPDVPKSPWPE